MAPWPTVLCLACIGSCTAFLQLKKLPVMEQQVSRHPAFALQRHENGEGLGTTGHTNRPLQHPHTQPQTQRHLSVLKQPWRWCWSIGRLLLTTLPGLAVATHVDVPRANAIGEGVIKAIQDAEAADRKYSDDGLGLVETLKKRTAQNKAKNDRTVLEKTFLNSEAGIYGPFDKFVPVLTKEGKYVLLKEEDYQAEVDAGRIKGRDYVVETDEKQDAVAPAVVEQAKTQEVEAEPQNPVVDADDEDLI